MHKLVLAIVNTTGTATTSQIENSLMPLGFTIHQIDGAIGYCRSKGLLQIAIQLPGVRHEHLFY